jgi:hypothetical protein
MRSHGVPNFPDPSPGGGLLIPSGSGIDPQSPAFQDAQKACGALAPGGNGPPQMSETQRQHALAFAKCMRANGESKFPDPTLRPGNGVQLVLSIHGMVFALKAGIDPRSPSFRQAATACGLRLPSPGGKAQWAPAP